MSISLPDDFFEDPAPQTTGGAVSLPDNFFDDHEPEGTTAGDYSRSLAIGLNRFGQTVGRGIDVVGNLDPTRLITESGEGIIDRIGQGVEAFYKKKEQEDYDALSPAMKDAMQLKYTEDTGKSWREAPVENFKSLFSGDAWKSPQKVAGSLLQSTPSTAVGMGTGAAITYGLIKKGVSAGLAGVVGGFIGEGSVASVESGKDIYDMVANAPQDVLSQTDEYQKAWNGLESEGLSDQARDEQAREIVADHAAMKSMAVVFGATGTLGSVSGHYLGKLIGGEAAGGLPRQMATAAAAETLQETPQSAFEVLEHNVQKKKYVNPNQNIMEGVKEAGVEGGVQGFVMGAGMGAGGSALGRSRTTNPEDAISSDPAKAAVSDAENTEVLDRVIEGDTITKETTDTRERPFDPTTFEETQTEDWEMALRPTQTPLTQEMDALTEVDGDTQNLMAGQETATDKESLYKNVDELGNWTMPGNTLDKILNKYSDEDIIDVVKWANQQSPHVKRNVAGNAAAILRSRGVPVDEIAWQESIKTAKANTATPPTEVQAPSQKDTEQQTPGASADGVTTDSAPNAADTSATTRGVLPGKPGKKGTAYTNDNSPVEFTYQTVPLESLIPSHDGNMNVNPAYPKELQPRDRSRAMSSVQVENIAKKLNPERLGESTSVAHGAPIVLPDGTVLSGNGRVLALKKATEFGTIEKYREYLKQNTDKFGTSEDGILVRVVDPQSIGDPVAFAQKANESDVAKMSATEQAVVDAGNLTEDDMAAFKPTEDGDMAAPSNRSFLERFVQRMSAEERSGYLTADGNPSRQLIDRVQQAIFQKAYGSESLLKMTAEEANPEIKNILNGLQAGARDFARTRTLNPEMTDGVVAPIMDAVEFIRKAQREYEDITGGLQNRVNHALSQMDMFETSLSEEARVLTQHISKNIRSGKRIGELVKEIGSLYRKTLAEINQQSIFGEEQQDSILDRAIRTLEEKYGTESEVNQRTADKVTESPDQGRRSRNEQEGQEKDQISEPLQGDLFNADPKTEKQLDLFPVSAGIGKKSKTSGSKPPVKTDSKGKGQTAQGGMGLDQTQRVGVRTTGYIQHRGLVAKGSEDVASIFSHLIDNPQERLYTLTTDKDGQIIEIHAYTKGVRGASQAVPGEMAGRIFAHKNAKKAYFVHNHPSGDPSPSSADRSIARQFKNILRLRGIDSQGIIVTRNDGGEFRYRVFDEKSTSAVNWLEAPDTVKKTSIPVVERVFIDQKRGKTAVGDSLSAKKAMKNRPSGFLLLTNKQQEVGFLPFPVGMPQKEITALLLEAADKTNAGLYIAYSKEPENINRLQFLDDLQRSMITSGGGVQPLAVAVEHSNGEIESVLPPDPKKTPEVGFDKVSGETPVYQTNTDYTPGQGITLSDIQARFPGQAVFLSPDGSISIRMKNGLGLRITSVESFGGDDINLAMQTGRMDKDGVILGKYQDNQIALNKDLADTITRDHEVYHFLVDNILNKLDRAVIKGRATKMNQDGTFNFRWSESMEENEANAFAQLLNEREKYRGTALGRILQKVVDFFDGIWHVGRQSVRKLAREVESGRVFERDAGQPRDSQGRYTFAGPESRTADKSLAFEAQQMRDSGASRVKVWKDTGWWEIVPGSNVFSYEIDDSGVRTKAVKDMPSKEVKGKKYKIGTVEDVIEAPRLFESYPGLKDVQVVLYNFGSNQKASFREKSDFLKMPDTITVWGIDYNAPAGNKDLRSSLLHEVQHYIQTEEQFARGGSTESMDVDSLPENPKWRRWKENEQKVKEAERLRNTTEYEKEFIFSNQLFKKEYEAKLDAIEKQMDEGGDFETLSKEQDKIFDDYNKRAAREFPTLTKVNNISKEVGGLREPSRTISKDQGYMLLTGEAQSRLTQKRLDMTPAQRKMQPPWKTLEKMMKDEGLLQEGQKPEDVLISRFDGGGVSASIVKDKDELKELNSGKTVKVFRAMQVIDGELYPPMSAKVGGKLRRPTKIGQWEKADENPDLADDKGYFKLDKGNKKSIKARYNPYFHTSASPLNDQFSSAYDRPNLVTVEAEIPASELTSGYQAEKAKDSVGEKQWHSGPVSSKLSAGKKRTVILSRYAKVLRIVPDSEVAKTISKLLEGENVTIPAKVVTPSLKTELQKRGVSVAGNPDIRYQTAADRTDIIDEKFAKDPTTKERVSDLFNKAKSKEERALATDRMIAKTLDSLHFIKKRLGDEPYKMHRMLTGINSSTFSTWLKHGEIDVNGNTFNVKGVKEGPLEFLNSLGKTDSENLVYWVAAKRAEQLEAEGRENWLDKTARDQIFQRVGTKSSKGKPWAVLNTTLQKYNSNILDVAEKAGLIDPIAREEWNSNFYIPFNRIMEDEATYESFLAGPRRNKQHISSQIRKLKGGENKIADPIENLFRNWMFLLDASARNMARSKAFDAGKKMGFIEEVPKKDLLNIVGSKSQTRWAVRKEGTERAAKIFDTKADAEAWTSGRKGYSISQRKYSSVVFGRMKDFGIMSFQQNGNPVYFKTKDQDLFEALSEIDITAFNNVFMKLMGGSKRLLSFGVTIGPAFRIRNLLRDTIHVSVVSRSFKPFVDSAKGFMKAMKEDADFREYSSSGFAFGSSYVHTDDPGHASKMIKKLIKDEGPGAKNRILDTPKKLYRFWEKIGEAGENAARLGLYTNLRKQGKSQFEAGFQARDLMDFSLRGSSQTVQTLTRIIPFLNARAQGLYKLSRSASEDPKGFFLKASMLTAASLALWSLFKDDDRYKELQDWDKWTYYHFWLGDDHYRIPKPFEIGALFSSLPETVANTMNGTEQGKHVWDWFTFTAQDVFNVDMPQLFKPVIEERFNMSTFRGQRVVPEYMKKLKPSEQYKEYTSETMRVIGKALNISPIKLEHYVNGYFSTLGMMVLTSTDVVARNVGGFPSQPAGGPNPFAIGIMNKKYSSNKYVDRFYDFYDEVDTAYRTFNHLRKTGETEEAMEFRRKNAHLISLRSTTNQAKQYLSKINERIKSIRRNRNMSSEEKQKRIDSLNLLKKQATKRIYQRISR